RGRIRGHLLLLSWSRDRLRVIVDHGRRSFVVRVLIHDRVARRTQPADGQAGTEPDGGRRRPVIPESVMPEPVAGFATPRPTPNPGPAVAIPRGFPIPRFPPDRVVGGEVRFVLFPRPSVVVAGVDVAGIDRRSAPNPPHTANATDTADATHTTNAADTTN